MALVGVISDTHGVLPEKAYAALADCDYIIHAGDIGDPKIIDSLQCLAPVFSVLGNNDFDEYGHEAGRFAFPIIEGVRFLVTHYPQDARIDQGGRTVLEPGSPVPKVCIHGHTHIPRILTGKEASPAQYILCPGSPIRPRGGSKRSIAKVKIEATTVKDAWIEELA